MAPEVQAAAHLHVVSQLAGDDHLNSTELATAPEVVALLKAGDLTDEPGLFAAAYGEADIAVAHREHGWIAVASCDGECDETAWAAQRAATAAANSAGRRD